jgi:prolyl 4-hydroxylase
LKQTIWDAAKQTIQDWTGEELTQCSLYGVRVYTEGAVLNTHVDRLPLVSSAIINVAADIDEPWPLEVIGHDGKAYNVTMEPGDMVLYESHSVLHGRPFPLKGRFVANLFVHFEPVGHSLRHHDHGQAETTDASQQYRQAMERGTGGHESDHEGLPPYLLPDSPEVSNYRSRFDKWKAPTADQADSGTTPAHTLPLLYATDKNGWTPLHEGARGGHIDVVKSLVEKGADLNALTHGGVGGTALYFALSHGEESAVYQFLESVGAIAIGPEL